MIHPATKKVPQLRGKGSTIKAMGPILVVLFRKYMDATSPIHNLILEGLKLSVAIDRILDDHSGMYRLQKTPARKLEEHCFEFCRVEATLVRHFHQQVPPIQVFNYTIKNHYMMHLGLVAGYINPSLGSCYQGEALMQTVKFILRACANGANPRTASNTAIRKYAYAIAFEMRKRVKD